MLNGLVAAEHRSGFEVYTDISYYWFYITVLFLNTGEIMKLLILLLSAAFLSGCANNQYEDYTPAIVVSSIEYDGEIVSLGCKGELKCEKETIECVYHFHKEAQNHVDKIKQLINSNKEDVPIITELYNALCNMYEVSAYISVLKGEDKEEWDILEKTGFIKQASIVASILTLKIRQLENSRLHNPDYL